MSTLWARPEALTAARGSKLLVLDVDGVLLDARPSFYEAAREVASWAAARALGHAPGPPVTDEEILAFKNAGGWNDDFDLACGIAWAQIIRAALGTPIGETARNNGGGLAVLLPHAVKILTGEQLEKARESVHTSTVRARCAARYAGAARCKELYGFDPDLYAGLPQEGLYSLEKPLCDAELLRSVQMPMGLFTGRNSGEAGLALERFKLGVPARRRIVDDGVVPKKPSPEGLMLLARETTGPVLFAGDTVDDKRAAMAYQQRAAADGLPELIFAWITPPEETDADAVAAQHPEAHIVSVTLDPLLRVLTTRNPS